MPSKPIRVPDRVFEELKILREKLGFNTVGDLVAYLLNVYKLFTECKQGSLQWMQSKEGLLTECKQTVDSKQSVNRPYTNNLLTDRIQVNSLSTDRIQHDVDSLLTDRIQDTDRIQTVTDDRVEVPEVKNPACPTCGCVGTPLMAIHSKGWIHRLLVECDGCGKQFVVYLGKSGLRKVDDFSSLKRKYPQCKLVPYEEFIKKYKPVRTSADTTDTEF